MSGGLAGGSYFGGADFGSSFSVSVVESPVVASFEVIGEGVVKSLLNDEGEGDCC